MTTYLIASNGCTRKRQPRRLCSPSAAIAQNSCDSRAEGRPLPALVSSQLRRAVAFYLGAKVALVVCMTVPLLLGRPAPFTPAMIALLELFRDLGASVAFVAEPAAAGLMQRPPRPAGERFLHPRQEGDIGAVGAALTLAVVPAYLLFDDPHARAAALPAWLCAHARYAWGPAGTGEAAAVSELGLPGLGVQRGGSRGAAVRDGRDRGSGPSSAHRARWRAGHYHGGFRGRSHARAATAASGWVDCDSPRQGKAEPMIRADEGEYGGVDLISLLTPGTVLALLIALGVLLLVFAVAGTLAYRKLRRSSRLRDGMLAVRTRALPPGPARELAQLRQRLRQASAAAADAVRLASSRGRDLGELPRLSLRLDNLARELDLDLELLAGEPDPARLQALLPAAAQRVDGVADAAAELRAASLSTGAAVRDSALTELGASLQAESERVRLWSQAYRELGGGRT